tara:strand:- start:5570 stop:6112 length:543 start_codon:yes stop_codon:yes gene_type:complete
MAEFDKAQPNQFEQRGTNPFNNPTPGESLTRDPEQKFPWEQPPQLTEVEPVIKEIFINITQKEKLLELLHLLRKGTPVDELTQVILYRGMTQGVYNTDLMMLLIEPVMYLLIAIAEEYEIDPVIYEGMDQDIAEEEDFDTAIAEKNQEEQVQRPTAKNVPSSILARVKTLPSEEELGAGE